MAMTDESRYVRFFKELTIEDVPLVGGKNASLGEMYRELAGMGVRIPNGFAVTAYAYRDRLAAAGAGDSRSAEPANFRLCEPLVIMPAKTDHGNFSITAVEA